MSTLLIICLLAAFCVAAYFIENRKSTGPRRWGWIQSWGKKPKSNKILFEDVFDTDFIRKIKNEKFPQHIIDRVQGKTQYQALELYNDGWRCGGGIDQSGRRILFRGESTAYVSLDVWSEVERLTWANRPLKRWSKEDWGKMDAVFKANPIQFHLGTDQLSERPAVVGEKGPETINGVEVPEMPMERVVSPSGKVYNWPDVRHPDFKISFDQRPMVDLFAELTKACNKVSWNIRISELKRRRFLPYVNPLGDTGAFRRTIYYDPIFPPMWLKYADRVSFRHKKGGSRG